MPPGIYPPDSVRREIRRVLLEHVGYGKYTASELYTAIANSSYGWWFSERALKLELSRINNNAIKVAPVTLKLFVTNEGRKELEEIRAITTV